MQGQLRKSSLSVTIDSECAHCARPFRIEIDSGLRYQTAQAEQALVFVPLIDFAKLRASSIIDDF